MRKINSKGFSSLEIVLLLVGLLIIIGTVIYVSQATKKSNDNLNVSNQSAQTPPKTTTKKVDTLTIKEWGVKIGLSQDSAGDYYKADDVQPQNPPEVIAIMSKKGDAIVGPTGISCKGEPIAHILRLPKDDPKWKDVLYVGASDAKITVGDYSYNMTSISQVVRRCFGVFTPEGKYKDPTAEKKFQTYINAFKLDFNSLTTQ
jgi:hypothetical protein